MVEKGVKSEGEGGVVKQGPDCGVEGSSMIYCLFSFPSIAFQLSIFFLSFTLYLYAMILILIF